MIFHAPPEFDRWAEVHALLVAGFAGMEGRIDPPSSLGSMTAQSLADKAATEILLLSESGGQIVACGFLRPEETALYLGKLAVRADHRRRGLLRALIGAAEAIARAQGLPTLLLQTRVELIENHRTFAALGFVEVARTAHPGVDRPTSLTLRRAVAPA